MKLTPKERAERKLSFREMGLADKIDYLYTYFKLPILVALIALFLLTSGVYRRITQKEAVLYAANINVSMGDDIESLVYADFIPAAGYNPKKSDVYLYRALYLSDNAADSDHEYAYASRMKLLASINSKQLDVVLMNREAYDILSNSGYLLSMPELLSQSDSVYTQLEPCLTANAVIVKDNAIEFNLNEADSYEAVTEEIVNAIDLTEHPLFQQAGYPDSVYLGVIANSIRFPAVYQYLEYLDTLAADMAA